MQLYCQVGAIAVRGVGVLTVLVVDGHILPEG